MGKELEAQAFDAEAFVINHGLQELADSRVEAHGSVFTVRQALVECPPFAKMVTSLAASLEHVPERQEILSQSIRSMAASAEAPAEPEAKKKLNLRLATI